MGATAGLKIAETGSLAGSFMSLVQTGDQAGGTHQPRPPRQRTLIRAVMRAPGVPGHDVIVRNVSERGMRIASRGISPHVGEMLRITLPDAIETEGQVRWANGDEFGIELTADLDLRRLGLTNQRRHASNAGSVIHWLVDERLRRPAQEPAKSLRYC